jgi:hypothetical protein
VSTQAYALDRRSTRPMLFLAAFAALALSMLAMVGPAMATHVAPVFVAGNNSCAQLGDYDHEFKIEPVESGTYDDPASDFVVTITVNDTPEGQTFDFESNLGVDAVFVKGGDNGNLYVYSPAETADTGLHAPLGASGKWAGLSHISFCFNDVPESTPTPTPTPVVTPTPTPEETPAGETPTPTPEQSVEAGTGTPAPSQPNTAMAPNGGPSPIPTLVFGLILLASLGTLAYANVKTVRSRS